MRVTDCLLPLIAATVFFFPGTLRADEEPERCLAFQIFTASPDNPVLRNGFPPGPASLRDGIVRLRDMLGTKGSKSRRLGFILGPLALDHSDDEVRALITRGFEVALQTGVAVGFHLDDSMFWNRRTDLNKPENLEWLDWNGTPSTGRRIDWSENPLKLLPQLCYNSPDVKHVVAERAQLIGYEIKRGLEKLRKSSRTELFVGVIAGWEPHLGRDFDTGRRSGYHALHNAGFSAEHPPADLDLARCQIVHNFIALWVDTINAAGIPPAKIFTHASWMSQPTHRMAQRINPSMNNGRYLQDINFSPPETAFVKGAVPGFSTYPQPGQLEEWQVELARHGTPPWASTEGSAIDPGSAGHEGSEMNMETYLGNLFNHGAVMVNIFGWDIGDAKNPFRLVAENPAALEAYRKFLRGEQLAEAPIPIPSIPPADLPDKIHRIQAALPGWLQKHEPSQMLAPTARLDAAIKEKRFDDAAKEADDILRILEAPPAVTN